MTDQMTDIAMSTTETIAFWVLAPLAVAGGIGMLLSRNAVHSALWLVSAMMSLAVMYMVQGAPFLGVVQIIVYTGAVMILFLFVLMLVGRDYADALLETLRGQRLAAALLGVVFAVIVGAASVVGLSGLRPVGLGSAGFADNVTGLAAVLFSDYVVAFEAVAALLVVAVVGAMLLSHIPRTAEAALGQRRLSQQRFRTDARPTPLPGPGVYATTNAVTTPAILADGSLSADSVSVALDPARATVAGAAVTEGRTVDVPAPEGPAPDSTAPDRPDRPDRPERLDRPNSTGPEGGEAS